MNILKKINRISDLYYKINNHYLLSNSMALSVNILESSSSSSLITNDFASKLEYLLKSLIDDETLLP